MDTIPLSRLISMGFVSSFSSSETRAMVLIVLLGFEFFFVEPLTAFLVDFRCLIIFFRVASNSLGSTSLSDELMVSSLELLLLSSSDEEGDI